MSAPGEAFAAAAEDLVGVPFRLHGRDAARALDCVGVVVAALEAVGRTASAPLGYRLRQLWREEFETAALQSRLIPTSAPLAAGDVILIRVGPAQYHLLVASRSGGFVHAHASLRRVVHAPPPLEWPEVRRWRLKE